MNDHVIRRATASDTEHLAALGRATFLAAFAKDNDLDQINRYVDEAFSLKQIQLELADPKAHFVVVERDQQLFAYAKLLECDAPDCVEPSNTIQLERIYVSLLLTGTGIGSALMQRVVDLARQLAFQHIWLGVWSENTGAIRFYERLGYRSVGEKIFMMDDDPQSDLVMLYSID